MEATGDCYEAALTVLSNYPDDAGALLCHGTCTGRGPIEGVAFGHAWVEVGDYVIDASNGKDPNRWIAKEEYYRVGECREVRKYTRSKARHLMKKYKHCGPWHGAERIVSPFDLGKIRK